MKKDDKLTRQDEDISAPEFAADEHADRFGFKSWPELLGVVMLILLLWMSFGFTG